MKLYPTHDTGHASFCFSWIIFSRAPGFASILALGARNQQIPQFLPIAVAAGHHLPIIVKQSLRLLLGIDEDSTQFPDKIHDCVTSSPPVGLQEFAGRWSDLFT